MKSLSPDLFFIISKVGSNRYQEMDTLTKYRVWCNTENKFVETWKTNKPSVCPNDYRHSINHGQIIPMEQKLIEAKADSVMINSKNYFGTHGYYLMQGLHYHVPNTSGTHIFDRTFTFRSCIYGLNLMVEPNQLNDTIDILINPGTLVGLLTANASAGATMISVSPTVTANVVAGFFIMLDNGVTTEERQVIEVDQDDGTLTLDSPLTNAWTGMATMIKVNMYVVKDYIMGYQGLHQIGYGNMGGKPLEKNTTVRVVYYNTENVAKHMHVNIEYTY